MASDQQSGTGRKPAAQEGKSPDWADGLKQLYDAVVDEPLPDAFRDLLDKLDDSEASSGDPGQTGAS